MLGFMPKPSPYDRQALTAALNTQDQVITRRQAFGYGMSAEVLRHKLRAEGPWQVALPGVYVAHNGSLTVAERIAAAFLYAKSGIAVTGPIAASRHGIPCDLGDFVDVLVPLECRRANIRFVRMHRTKVIPEIYTDGLIPYASPARAVADAVRQLDDISAVRAIVAAGVQRRKVAISQLMAELQAGPSQGSARLREVLAEVADGVRSSAEGDLRTVIRKNRLPTPLYNPDLYCAEEFVARPDAWWPEAGVAAEVDSMEWHLKPEDWKQTIARHDRMTALGILVLHFPPSKVRDQGWIVARQIRQAIESSRGPLAHIRTIPAAHG